MYVLSLVVLTCVFLLHLLLLLFLSLLAFLLHFFFFFFCFLVKIICLCTCLHHLKKFKKRIVLIADDALHASPLPSSLSVVKYLKNRYRMCYVKVPPEYHSAQRKSP